MVFSSFFTDSKDAEVVACGKDEVAIKDEMGFDEGVAMVEFPAAWLSWNKSLNVSFRSADEAAACCIERGTPMGVGSKASKSASIMAKCMSVLVELLSAWSSNPNGEVLNGEGGMLLL